MDIVLTFWDRILLHHWLLCGNTSCWKAVWSDFCAMIGCRYAVNGCCWNASVIIYTVQLELRWRYTNLAANQTNITGIFLFKFWEIQSDGIIVIPELLVAVITIPSTLYLHRKWWIIKHIQQDASIYIKTSRKYKNSAKYCHPFMGFF